jgi:hypothetical protein
MRLSPFPSFFSLILLSALPAHAAISVVQSNSNTTTTRGTTVSASFSNNTKAGNLIAVACLSVATSGNVSVSDHSNSYISVSAYNVKLSLGGVQWSYAKKIAGGADAVTCTFSTSSKSRSIFIYEISGLSSLNPFDIQGESRGQNATPDTRLVNSISANEIVLGAAICASTCSPGSGFTGLSDGHGNEAEFRIVTAMGAQHTPFSQASGNWADSMIAFRDVTSNPKTIFSSTAAPPQDIHEDTYLKAPNPWADITRYGARSIPTGYPPASPGVMANITAAQTRVAISSPSSFQNGDGVVIYGAGAAHSMTTPQAPSVTPSLAASGTGTGLVANGPFGRTTYNYQIVARNKQGGICREHCWTHQGRGSIAWIELSPDHLAV